jgi:hypothetical protein
MMQLNDTPNEHAYLLRLLRREQARLQRLIEDPGPLRAGAVDRIQEDLVTVNSILAKL